MLYKKQHIPCTEQDEEKEAELAHELAAVKFNTMKPDQDAVRTVLS